MTHAPHTPRVLVVEDEDSLRDFFVLDLRSAGFEVLEAHDGEAASAFLTTEAVDAVLSDVKMPKKSGIELLEEVRAHRNPAKPIFVLISGASTLAIDDIYAHGVNVFLEKPFKRHHLVNELVRLTLPQETCWDRTSIETILPDFRPSGRLELDVGDLDIALQRREFLPGHRGFFVASESSVPEPAESFDFSIRFTQNSGTSTRTLQGSGIVRWSRPRSSNSLAAGFGFEILTLTPESTGVFEDLLRRSPTIATIPRG